MTVLYTQDATPTNPFGIGYHEQMVDISKRLIAERTALQEQLDNEANNGPYRFTVIRDARNALRDLQATPNADPAAVAAASANLEQLRAARAELTARQEQNVRLLQETQRGLVENEDRLSQARAKAASQPGNRPIVNAGADPAAQTPTTPTNLTGAVPPEQPLNVTTPAANQATAVPTSGDEALQATEDVQAAALGAQEGRAFAPTPVVGDEALAATNTAEAAIQTRAPNAVGIDAGGNAVGLVLQDETGAVSTLRRNPETGELYNPGTIPLPENVQAYQPPPVPPQDSGYGESYGGASTAEQTAINRAIADNAAAAATKAKLAEAQEQSTIQQRFNQTTQGDWRVRLSLATGSDYLYNSNDPGILKALRDTNGIIFPYTPSIQTNYTANYDKYELTHSNHRGYFYKNSQVGDIQITGSFTAQDTAEATYLLAVIHFFRSVTKMFYGQDEQRGAPPPLCFLDGMGEYQFNNHPVLISSFQYNLPADVDYIRVDPNNQGLSLAPRQPLISSSPGSTLSSVVNRLKNAGLPKGANVGGPVDLGTIQQQVSGTGQTTYVPTKIEISITLLPVNTRSQVSQQFSLNRFANGDLLKKGFW